MRDGRQRRASASRSGGRPQKALGHGAGDGRLGVGVASEGDGEPDGVLVVVGVEEGDEGLGDRALAGDIEAVVGADVSDGSVEVVAEAVGDFAADVFFGGTGAGEENGGGGGMGALDALGVVVGDGGGTFGFGEGLVEGSEGPTDGADAHRGAVAEGVVGAGVVAEEPLAETAAPAAVGVAPPRASVPGTELRSYASQLRNSVPGNHDAMISKGGKYRVTTCEK